MSLNLNVSHGEGRTSIADIQLDQEIELLTENTIVPDDIYLTLTGVKYYTGGILPSYVEIPYTQDYEFTGSTITPVWTNYDPSLMTMSGTTSAISVGTYGTIFTLKDPDMIWSDQTSGPKTVRWSILRKALPIPYANEVHYTGSEVSPTWYNYDPLYIKIGGTTAATNVGTYTATFTLRNNNFEWEDGTIETKNIQWVITNKWYKVEFIGDDTWEYTPDIPNPDPILYDGVYQSNNERELPRAGAARHWKIKITFNGYEQFKVYLRSYSLSSDQTLAWWLDNDTTQPTPLRNYGKGKNSVGTSISDYTEVTYNNPDVSTSHFFIISYRRGPQGGVAGDDKGYLLIKRNSDASN